MEKAIWTIYWNEYSSDTYLYGSEIEFVARNNVHFKNQEQGFLLLLFNFFVENSLPMESVREAWLSPDLMTSIPASLLPLPAPCS